MSVRRGTTRSVSRRGAALSGSIVLAPAHHGPFPMGASVGAQAVKVPQIQFFDDKVAGQFQFLDKVMVGPLLRNVARWGAVHRQVVLRSCDAVAGPLLAALLRNAWLDSEYMFCVSSWVLWTVCLFSTRRGKSDLRSSLSCSSVYGSASHVEWRSVHRRCFSAFLSWRSHLKIGHYVHEALCTWQFIVRCSGVA